MDFTQQLADLKVSTQALQLISAEQAWHYSIFPCNLSDQRIEFYINEERALTDAREELELLLGKEVVLFPVQSASMEILLQKYYIKKASPSSKKIQNVNSDDFVYQIIAEAKSLRSSDIHIEAFEESARVRFRIDGQLVEKIIIKKQEYPALINKVKIMANLDIAEKRLPQDGRIFYKNLEFQFDIRVSVLPTLHGEKIVLRILSNDATNIHLESLGFSKTDLDHFMEGIRRPNGIILISGPTGSGKTTTLYATLKILNKSTRNIITIEDPVEYTLPGINQVQLRENIGMDFAKALRTFLRQDPDIIMVGEIRDPDTAQIAIRAALTGHLVLSTIHTNSAWGTVSRLLDMGIPSYLLANTLNLTVAQRLIRLLCPHCKKATDLDNNIFPQGFKPFENIDKHYIPQGCDHCHHTGYKGRKAVYEVIPVDSEISELIKKGSDDISENLSRKKIMTLSYNAFYLLKNGQTSIEEIYPLLLQF